MQLTDSQLRDAIVLAKFSILCKKMKNDVAFKNENLAGYRQFKDRVGFVKVLYKTNFAIDLEADEAMRVAGWLAAYFSKGSTRKPISPVVRNKLYEQQKGKCALCKGELPGNGEKAHVDHIIPFDLVGDELGTTNYQLLCERCNLSKSNNVNYQVLYYLGLV